MANSPLWYNATAIASVNAVTALLNSGYIKIYSGSPPAINGAVTGTLLASLQFSATAFPTAVATGSGATATANAISSGTAAAGTAGYFVLVKSDNSTVVMSGSVGTSGSFDLLISPSLTLTLSATVSCSQFLITEVQT